MSTTPETKTPKKRSVTRNPDGSRTVTFAHGGTLAYSLNDYPQNVRDFFTLLGMDTARRNAGVGAEDDGTVGTAEQMMAREAAKHDAWMRGELSIARDAGEKSGIPLLWLEATSIYKAMKACVQATGDFIGWENEATYARPAPESLRAEVEALDDVVVNEADVTKAREAALASGASAEAAEAAAEKVKRTRLDVFRANDLFKLALAEAEETRRNKKKAALRDSIRAKAAASAQG